MPKTKTRIVGSGFTSIVWRGTPLAFLDSFDDKGQTPLNTPYEAVFPIGVLRAVEIATNQVLDIGTASFSIREEWNQPVWQQFPGLEEAADISDVFRIVSEDPTETTFQRVIKPPGANQWRGTTYHNVVVSSIPDDENVTVAKITQTKTVTAVYTHKTPFTLAAA